MKMTRKHKAFFRQFSFIRFENQKGYLLFKGAGQFFLLFVFLFALPSYAIEAMVKDVRVGEIKPGIFRFVLETDRRVPFQVFLLDFPERMVIDLPTMAWQDQLELNNQIGAPIKTLRHGLFRDGVTRIVMDLDASLKLLGSARLLPNSDTRHRLYIDFEKATQSQDRDFFQTDDWPAYSRSQGERGENKPQKTVKKNNKKKRVIILDPGHGGLDPGAASPLYKNLQEKKIVLAFAKTIKKKLEKNKKYQVILTRKKDVFVPLRARYKIAEKHDADLFISIHADSIPVSKVRGLTLYTLSEKASDEAASELAKIANQSDILAGYNLDEYSQDVSSILLDLSRDSTNQESWRFAQNLMEIAKKQVPVSKKPYRSAGFAVLKSPTVPSILLELGYMTNKQDIENLRSASFQKKVANVVQQGIDRYFEMIE